MTFSSTALVIEPDRAVAAELAGILFTDGIDCVVTDSGDHGWNALFVRRPDLVLIDLATPDLARFHKRMRDEYMGKRPRLVGIASAGGIAPGCAKLDLDAVVLRPLRPGALLAALASDKGCPILSLDVGRMRELLKLSCLGTELQASLDNIAHRLVLVYGVANCYVIAAASERQWVGSVGEAIAQDAWAELWDRCDEAVNAGASLLLEIEDGDDHARLETRIGVAIRSPSGAVLGAICLIDDGASLLALEARDALRDLAVRLGVELSWRSVHDRVANERDRLRETAMLDPMLGVLSRGALEQALATEISRIEHAGEPLAIAVIDVVGLRHINDRLGHLAGDAALRHVSDTTRRMVRAQDIVGRSGDDEIAVLFGSTSIPAASAMLERIRRAIESDTFDTGDGEPASLEVAIGITEWSGPDDDGHLLSRAARTAAGARQRGGAIAITDASTPSEDTKPGVAVERFEAGVTLGGMYQIVHEISRGAMGVVYRAEDLGLSRPVALKMLRPDLVTDVDLVRRFREEAAVLASLNHGNLVRVYSFVEDHDDVFFVMELVEGLSLDNLIIELSDHDDFVAPSRAAALIRQVAGALDAMHAAGVLHRDVKPGNVVIDRTSDRAVLVDVGLARKVGDRTEPAGTPGFIAPESFRGEPEGPETDVYGLAATAYALLTGHAPFGRADDYREILRRQIDEPPPPPSSLRADLTMAVDEVILRGLAVRSKERFASASGLAQALEQALGTTDHGLLVAADDDAPHRAEKHAPRRTLTLEVEMLRSQFEQQPMSRGVVFRAVSRVLGMRTTTTWLRTLERSEPALAEALSLRTPPLAWLPGELFSALLAAVAASGRDAEAFARELAIQVVSQSFRQLFPSDPERVSPSAALAALDILWRRYHSWGHLRVPAVDDHSARIELDGPRDRAICGFVGGWLEQVLAQAGGRDAKIVHTRCLARGDVVCEFAGRWAVRAAG